MARCTARPSPCWRSAPSRSGQIVAVGFKYALHRRSNAASTFSRLQWRVGQNVMHTEFTHHRNWRKIARLVFRVTSSAAGAALGLSLLLLFIDPPSAPLFLASFGGSAVFLFGLTRAPAAQPRALFGGHVGCALVGVACYLFFGDAIWVYILALVLTLVFMLVTKTVHPPAGANPLIMLHAHASLIAIWQPVVVGIAILALVAAAWSRLVPGMMHYPCRWFEKSPPFVSWGGWLE